MGQPFTLSLYLFCWALSWAFIAMGDETGELKRISLCIKPNKHAYVEVLNELLEMQLLIMPSVQTEECGGRSKKNPSYELRQEVTELETPADHGRVQVMLTLYDHNNVPIMSQVEFIERMTRHSMAARARMLASSMVKAIEKHDVVFDPFTLSAKPALAVLPVAEIPSTTASTPILQTSRDSAHSFELFLGFQRFAQGRYKEVYSRRKAMVVTKPFMFIGGRHSTRVFRPLFLTNTVKAAITPYELSRPIGVLEPHEQKVLKMVDLATDIAWQVVSNRYFETKISLRLAAHYLNSTISEHIPEAHLSTYWQFKQGMHTELVGFLGIFDTSLAINAGYYPFVQNLSMMSLTPFKNFGWQFGVSVESTLYRSFGLKLSLCHAGDNFAYRDGERVVSFNSVAYLGVVMRL